MGNESQRLTRDQMRAQTAYNCIKDLDENKQGYVQTAKKFPALVHTCGLAQAVAFTQSKGDEGYLKHLSTVMGIEEDEDLGEKSRTADVTDYQRYSREAVAAATWLKRYAEAMLE